MEDQENKGTYKLEEVYHPSQEVQDEIFEIYTKYLKWRSYKTQLYKQFNNQTLDNYLMDSRQKFWGYLPISDDVDTPQFFFPETRNQIIKILSQIAALKPKASFEGVENFDIIKATVLGDLFEYWRRKSNRKIQNFWQYLYNIINGTVIVYTAYRSNVREVKNVTMYNSETGETKYTVDTLDTSDVEDMIVNLEDIFIPKMWQPDIQEQGELIWRVIMRYDDFKFMYKGYKNVDLVRPGAQFSDQSIFYDFLPFNIRTSDYVEVIKYFNSQEDEYAILANGVLLNSIMVSDETGEGQEEELAPLPWNHKQLPFSKTIFEPLDANFFFGMPLAQKVKSPQEALNMLWELMLERETRAVNVPIITNDPSVEMGIEFKPGRVYQVQGDPNSYKELQMNPTSGSFWNALTALDGMVQNTGSGGGGPISPSIQPRSARENMLNAQQQQQVGGIYNIFYQDLLEQKSWLTIKNMIQFYTSGKVKKILGEREFNKIITLTNTMLRAGGIGNREIRVTNKPVDPDILQKESYFRSLLRKERVEIIEVTPEALNALNFDIKMQFEQENSPESERFLFLDYITTVFKLFGQSGIISPKKAFFRISEKFNENPSDLVEDNVLMDYEQERFGIPNTQPINPQQVPSESQLPATQQYNNSMRGTMNGANGPMGNAMEPSPQMENNMNNEQLMNQ